MGAVEKRRSQRLRNIERSMETCKHFNGVQHKTCGAGVIMASVRDTNATWPCLPPLPGRAPCSKVCERRQFPTREEAEATENEREDAIGRFLIKLGTGVCGVCGVTSTDWEQVGNCIYSKTCGHRVGQGDAHEYKKAVLEGRRAVTGEKGGERG